MSTSLVPRLSPKMWPGNEACLGLGTIWPWSLKYFLHDTVYSCLFHSILLCSVHQWGAEETNCLAMCRASIIILQRVCQTHIVLCYIQLNCIVQFHIVYCTFLVGYLGLYERELEILILRVSEMVCVSISSLRLLVPAVDRVASVPLPALTSSMSHSHSHCPSPRPHPLLFSQW